MFGQDNRRIILGYSQASHCQGKWRYVCPRELRIIVFCRTIAPVGCIVPQDKRRKAAMLVDLIKENMEENSMVKIVV